MKAVDFKKIYSDLQTATPDQLKGYQGHIRLFMHMTDEQISMVRDLLISKGYKEDQDGNVNFGIMVFMK